MTGIEQGRFAQANATEKSAEEKRTKILTLNDHFRRTGLGGKTYFTDGIESLGTQAIFEIRQEIAMFNAFSEDSDSYGEHDFGSINYAGYKVFWKIDYYGKTIDCGSSDPSIAANTTRVLTIMLAQEY